MVDEQVEVVAPLDRSQTRFGPRPKLSDEEVYQIRRERLGGSTFFELEERWGVSRPTLYDVVYGRGAYEHVGR